MNKDNCVKELQIKVIFVCLLIKPTVAVIFEYFVLPNDDAETRL